MKFLTFELPSDVSLTGGQRKVFGINSARASFHKIDLTR